MAGKMRPERVQEALRQEVSRIIHNEIKDPRLGFITVTNVELTKDLRYAKVHFSVLENDKKMLTLKGLNSAKGFIKCLIGERLKLRFMPEISFRLDESVEKTQHIYDILRKIEEEKKNREDEDVDKKGDRGPKKA